MDGFRNKHGEGVRVYIRGTIRGKILEKHIPQTILNVFLKNFFSKNGSGYFVERIIRHLKMMKILS